MGVRSITRSVIALLGGLATTAARAEPPATAPPTAPATVPATLPSAFPAVPEGFDLKAAPAAAWLKPGARLSFDRTHGTHYFAPDQIAPGQPGDQGQASVPDPARPGKWLTVHAYKSEAVANIVQYQVVAVGDGKVYCALDVWQPTHLFLPGGEMVHCPDCPAAGVYPAGSIDSVYFSPALLAVQRDDDAPGRLTRRETVTRDGRQVAALDALRYDGPLYYSAHYDLETGLLLSRVSQFQAPGSRWVFEGQSPRGALVIDTLNLRAVRQVPYPWVGKPAPDWVRTVKSTTIGWEKIVEDRTSPRGPLAQSGKLVFHVVERGPDWLGLARFEAGKAPGPGVEPIPNTLVLAGSALGPGSLFLPPAGLADLKQGQRIDSDPATKMTVTVTSVERKGDANVVGFTAECPAFTSRTFYNRATGALVYQQVDTLVLPGRIEHVKLTPVARE